MTEENPPEVHHDESAHRFYVEQEGKTAYLDYGEKDADTVDYRRTYTPPDMRGRGLASRITREALDWARRNDRRVIPSCPFVRDFIDENPEYRDLQVSSST